jgi:hypothetical protein
MLSLMTTRRSWKIAVPIVGAILLAMTGCSQDPADATTEACESAVVMSDLRDDVKMPHEVVAKANSVVNRPDSAAYDITGTTTLSFSVGADEVHEWKCFSQVADGETYANVRFWDGVAVPGTTQ